MVGTLRRMCSVLQPAGTAGAAGTYLGPTIIYLLYRANVPLCAEEGWVQQNARVHAHTHTHPPTNTNKCTRTARLVHRTETRTVR